MSAFETLNEKVRRWIWQQGWEGLRDVQERSIPIILAGQRDAVIMAATAGGKTEAAFLPIVSRLADGSVTGTGFSAIYVSPMRALINDQFSRMESLCADLDIQVTKWHGDVSASQKARARRYPSGILLITPESLEGLLVLRGKEIARLFAALHYVVIDEMHVFLDDPRGKQLQSVLHRIDLAAGTKPVRIGLSATLADVHVAQSFLRPLDPARVEILPPGPGAPPIKLQLRGYVREGFSRAAHAAVDENGEAVEPKTDPADRDIARHIFLTNRGHRSLIFAGSRGSVETITVRLAEMGEAAGVPEEFFPHHGNLSKEHREHAESRMKDSSRPASIVCTTTLELGIDVGQIESVAQIGPGYTVSGMRQRIGRSGRRPGQPAIMRVYVKELALLDCRHPIDSMRSQTVQTIAMLNLMLLSWYEPPDANRLNLSTLLHQIMALIGQRGGVTPVEAWDVLVKSGVFTSVNMALFKQLLSWMGSTKVELLEQAADGLLLPGPAGERLLESRDIFAVFVSPEEYRVIAEGGKAIGQVPGDNPLVPNELLVLGGRRWRIIDIDTKRREISVRPAKGGNPPSFGGDGRLPADGVVQEMRKVWEDFQVPTYLDQTAKDLLAEARSTYGRLGLRNASVARHDGNLLLFPWVGEKKQRALVLALANEGLEPTPHGVAVSVQSAKRQQLSDCLKRLASGTCPSPLTLAKLVKNKAIEKFDPLLSDELITLAWARDRIDTAILPEIATVLLASLVQVKADVAK